MAILSHEERQLVLDVLHQLLADGMPDDDKWHAQLVALAGPDHDADNRRTVASIAAELGSGATDQGKPGRTRAAACPSHITQLNEAPDPDWRAD